MLYLSLKDVATDLGISLRTVQLYCKDGFLPAITYTKDGKQKYQVDNQRYVEWKNLHFRGIKKGQISRLTRITKEMTLEELRTEIEVWIDWCATGKLSGKPVSPRMVEIYQYYIGLYLKGLGKYPSKPIISIDNLRNVLGSYAPERFSTKLNIYSAVMSLAKYLIEQEKLEAEIRERLKKLRPKRYFPAKRPCINEKQLQQVITYIDNLKRPDYYHRLLSKTLILFMARTGLRASEVGNLTLKDVNLDSGVIDVILGKGRKSRKVGICKDLKPVLEEYLKARLKRFNGDRFFISGAGTVMNAESIHQKVDRVAKHFDFHFTPHALRRAFVTINVAKNINLVYLQVACGHSDITTTRSYCQTSQDEVIEAMKEW